MPKPVLGDKSNLSREIFHRLRDTDLSSIPHKMIKYANKKWLP